MTGGRRPAVAPFLAVAALLLPAPALAHAFGGRYDLPLPLGFFLFAGGAAVALTFLALIPFRKLPEKASAWEHPLSGDYGLGRLLSSLEVPLRLFGVLAFALVVAVAFLGPVSPTDNLAAVSVWVLWWVGFTLFTAFAGNLWDLVNPWATLFAWSRLERIAKPPLAFPRALGSWPALFFFLLFVWTEMVGAFGEDPRRLGWLIVGYSLVTWGGMALFGRAEWLNRADPFHRFFGLVGRFACLGRSLDDPGAFLVLRPPGRGLLGGHPESFSAVLVVMAILSSVTFDGFSETPLWAELLTWLSESQTLRPLLVFLSAQGLDLLAAIKTAALLAAPVIATLAYLLTCAFCSWAARGPGFAAVVRSFALTLLPIAIAYHLAHYLSYLALAGQLAIPLISDPFGLGWNLFGTAGYVIDAGVMGAKEVWYLSVAAIVCGHVISVALAHVEALRLYSDPGQALRSQLPMLLLMVGFTMASLWILAQPIVQTP